MALVGDASGRIIGRGAAGPCNHVASAVEGREKLARVVRECVTAALYQAGLASADVVFEAACYGMSGGAEDKQDVLEAAVAARQMLVTHDAAIALTGATAGRPGIITVAGTGSIAYGRTADGREMRAGGWGYVFGDEGGAFDIVRQATRAMLRQHEGGGPPTALTPLLLEAAGCADANHMLHLFYTADWPRSRVARLAPLVDQAAALGDTVALRILDRAAQSLAELALGIRDSLFSDNHVPLSWIGGVFESPRILSRFRQLCQDRAQCAPPRYDPASGALLSAYALAGLHPELITG